MTPVSKEARDTEFIVRTAPARIAFDTAVTDFIHKMNIIKPMDIGQQEKIRNYFNTKVKPEILSGCFKVANSRDEERMDAVVVNIFNKKEAQNLFKNLTEEQKTSLLITFTGSMTKTFSEGEQGIIVSRSLDTKAKPGDIVIQNDVRNKQLQAYESDLR